MMPDRLLYDNEMRDFLNFASGTSIIAQIFQNGGLNYINDVGNYLKSSDMDTVTILPKSKYDKISDVWNEGRVKMKIGRFVTKFLNKYSMENFHLTCVEVEKFVNLYKSYFNNDSSKFEVVSGCDILKYYNEDNYYILSDGYRFGPLWNSCMRQSERNKFMEIYAKNDDIKMLVLFSEDGKVRGRALLWENVKSHSNDKEYKFMDRIYYMFEHDVDLFKTWAKEKGYIFKREQNAKSELYFIIKDRPVALELYVNLEKHDLSYYPYLDTFKFYNPKNGRFSNSSDFKYDHILTQSNGMIDREREEDEVEVFDDDDDDDL